MARKPKLILSYSPQGGTGKSTFAVNTALMYATRVKTLLVDMSLFGSIISTLKIRQKSGQGIAGILNLIDIHGSGDESGESLVQKLREPVGSTIAKNVAGTGLDVMVSANPIKMEGLNESATNTILSVLAELNYDVIIFDTSSELSIKNLILIDKVDYIIISAIQDVSCGWKLLMFKEIAQRFKVPREKFGILINRVSKYNGFNNTEFEVELGYKKIYEFPEFHKEFQVFVNRGDIITSGYNKKVYGEFLKLTSQIDKEVGVRKA